MSEITPDENGHFTIPEAGLYEWRGGLMRKVEPRQRIKCPDCAFTLSITPDTGVEATLEHIADTTHRVTPPLALAVGAHIHAEGIGGHMVHKAFSFNHVGHPEPRT